MKKIIALLVAAAATANAASKEVTTNTTHISAARSLELLAQENRFSRQLSGGLTIAAGAGTMYLANNIGLTEVCGWVEPEEVCAQDEFAQEFDSFYQPIGTGVGAAIITAGILQLAVPSRAERSWKQISLINSVSEREALAFSQLTTLASRAKVGRYTKAGVYGAGSALTLILSFSAGEGFPVLFGSSVVMAGLSAKNVIFKSAEEEALAGVAKPLSVQVMPTLDGGMAMLASFSF